MPRHATSRRPVASVLKVSRPSTVDLITVELRNAIYSGALPVGSRLGEVELAEQLGVSRGPLREASQRLVEEGLLTALPGRGLRVSVVDASRVADVYLARSAVEGQAIRVLAQGSGASADATAELERALADLEQAAVGADARAIGDADLAFHQALVDAARSRLLSRYMSSLVMLTRIASFSAPEGYSVPATVSSTYRVLLDALAAGDAEAALRALAEQFAAAIARLTGQEDVETVETPPDVQAPEITPIDQAALTS